MLILERVAWWMAAVSAIGFFSSGPIGQWLGFDENGKPVMAVFQTCIMLRGYSVLIGSVAGILGLSLYIRRVMKNRPNRNS